MKTRIKVKLTGSSWGNRGDVVEVAVNGIGLPDGTTWNCTSDPNRWNNSGYEIEIVDNEKQNNNDNVPSVHALLGQDIKIIEFK